MKIHMNDEASAKKWLSDAQKLNDEAEAAVNAAGQAVKNISEMADGTLIDELVLGGDKLIVVAKDLSDTMNGFANMVNDILKTAQEFLDNGKKLIKEAFKNIK